MQVQVGLQFSREFSFEQGANFSKQVQGFLNESFSGSHPQFNVVKIHLGFICVSKGFELFVMARPPKLYKKDASLEYEIKLDFDSFFKSDEQNRVQIGLRELLKQSKEIFENGKIKDFDGKSFIEALENCLQKFLIE